MMWGYDGHMGAWAWAFMGVGLILFWTALVLGIVALVRYLGSNK